MDIALVADLHGNWPATRAVDADITARGIKDVYCLGDMIGKGPSGKQTMAWTLERCKLVLAGNWDILVAQGALESSPFHLHQIGEEYTRIIQELQLEHTLWLSGRHIRLFHGRPVMPELLTHRSTDEQFIPYFTRGDERFDVLGYADAHMEAHRRPVGASGKAYSVFNTGSVGNAIGDTRAHYVILSGEMGDARVSGSEASEIVASSDGKSSMIAGLFSTTLVALEYDREQAIRDAMDATDMPNRDAYIREVRTGLYSR